MCQHVSAVKTHGVQQENCASLRSAVYEGNGWKNVFSAMFVFPSSIPTFFCVYVCVENISFQSRCVIVSSGKAFVALASKDRNKEAETHC